MIHFDQQQQCWRRGTMSKMWGRRRDGGACVCVSSWRDNEKVVWCWQDRRSGPETHRELAVLGVVEEGTNKRSGVNNNNNNKRRRRQWLTSLSGQYSSLQLMCSGPECTNAKLLLLAALNSCNCIATDTFITTCTLVDPRLTVTSYTPGMHESSIKTQPQ